MRLRLSFYFLFLCCSSLMANELTLDTFNSLKIAGPVNISLVKSKEYKAEFSMTKGRKEDLVFEVINSVLSVRIKAPENSKWNRPVSSANVTIYYIDLHGINCSSGSKVSSNVSIVANNFKLNCSKNAICRLKIMCKQLDLFAHNGSTIYLDGETDDISINISTNATFSSPLFVANNAAIDASSNASVSLTVVKKLDAKAITNAVIRYKGSPETKAISVNSGGIISPS